MQVGDIVKITGRLKRQTPFYGQITEQLGKKPRRVGRLAVGIDTVVYSSCHEFFGILVTLIGDLLGQIVKSLAY